MKVITNFFKNNYKKIIAIVLANNKISIPKIAREIEKGITVTKQYIANLRQKGIIKRVGPDKGGYWEICTTNI